MSPPQALVFCMQLMLHFQKDCWVLLFSRISQNAMGITEIQAFCCFIPCWYVKRAGKQLYFIHPLKSTLENYLRKNNHVISWPLHSLFRAVVYTSKKSERTRRASTPAGRIMWLLRGELGTSTVTSFGIRVFVGVIKISR